MLGACTDNTQKKREVICQAERIMQEQPDSALHILQSINRHYLRGELLARYALIYSIAQDKCGLDVTSDSLLHFAYEYYCQHPDDSLYSRCQYYMGLYYSLVDSVKQAEDCLRTSICCAEEQKEYYTQYMALDRLSSNVRIADAPLALEYSKQALRVFEKIDPPNFSNQICLIKDIGKVYILCNQQDSALYYMDLAIEKARTFNDSCIIGEIMQEKSLVYTKSKDYQKALLLAKEAWVRYPIKSLNLILCLAGCYADADSAAQAKDLYAVIINSGNFEQKYLAYRNMSVLAAKEHDDSSFLSYLDSAYGCMESVYKQQLKTKADYYNEVIKLGKDKVQKEKEINQKTLINWFFVMLVIVVLIIGLAIYNNISNRNRQRLEVERERHILKERFAREQHEREIKYKDNQITLMRTLVMKRCAFRKKIEEQKKNGKHITLSPEDWEEITAFLNATSDNFLIRLMKAYPNLRERDYQFCMLVRLKFSNKDLANIYGIAEVSIKQKMVDYKKRLNVSVAGLSFKQFISKF